MTFTETEHRYLAEQALGRLATIGTTGTPQNNPLTYRVNTDTGTIDIGGPHLSESQKYRNVQANPQVSLVVDDITAEPVGPGGQRGRGIEIRGVAEILHGVPPLMEGFSDELLRIHPRRIVAWNLDGPGPNARDVRTGTANTRT
ncbi:PPOX class F420-dependent oxidoreductase [Amycolatopsis cihanbeyliensis]|uniref:Pyridoxamine 5'-phosphate oxidase family protein n=1 Tax=Amycolatopsis cihanbeyliensis TaxID=1128664 RepID=A0A542CSU8_AMYCI|nr:PPOX class F420-dependent oxidoreductase [Amycolatopsis cihanbeyliensis]TQI93902.1 pyridoxamine 5'-phosphate oxidase family protein [Amycolatopsis cihanbeyliensis]